MEKQSKTLAGAFSNLKDSITQALTVEGDSLDELTKGVTELGDVLKDPSTIKAIQGFAESIVSVQVAGLKAGSWFSKFADEFSIDLVTLFKGTYDATSGLRVLESQLNSMRFATNINKEGLIDTFADIEKLLQFESIEELDAGIKRISKRIKEVEKLNTSGLASDNLTFELKLLKELNGSYEKLLQAKESLNLSDSKVNESGKVDSSGLSDTEIKALEKYEEKMRKLGQKMTDSIDPQAKFNAQIRELNDLRATGSITQEIYNQKLKQYQDTLAESQEGIQSTAELNKALTDSFSGQDQAIMRVRDRIEALNAAMDQFPERADEITQAIKRLEKEEKDLSKNTDSTTKQMQSLSENAARNMQSAFADFLFDPFDKGLDGMLKSFLRVMQRLLAESLALKIFSGLTALGPAPATNAPIVDSIPTMDGGGFTGGGSRMGGLDGKGGFLAMLHPQETVTDHTKGQSQAVSVNFTIQANDTKGFDELLTNRRGLITRMVNDAMNNSGKASLV